MRGYQNALSAKHSRQNRVDVVRPNTRAGVPKRFATGRRHIIGTAPDLDLVLAKEAKDQGAKVVVDLCDPHFSPLYDAMIDLADVTVCPTEYFRIKYLPKAVVIPDPYEMPELEPHASEGNAKLWFGHRANIEEINPWLKLDNLRVITGPWAKDEDIPNGITFWSLENVLKGLESANWTLFPTRPGGEYKSNNRVLNAIRGGTFPICNSHPSLVEFEHCIWTANLYDGIRFANKYPERLDEMVREAQALIRDQYSSRTVGEKWKSLLDSI